MSPQDAPSEETKTVLLPAIGGLDPLGLLDAAMSEGEPGGWMPPPPEVLEPLFHGFDQFGFINRGGMGAVYSARQKSLDRRVAIKILPPELGQDADFVDRFQQEARVLARLQHPHIVGIHDFGTTAGGHLYIVMEFVPGTSLFEVMKKQPLSIIRVVEVMSQVCEALQFAHDHGVVHRDIKPTNILLDDRGHARVVDFGLAKLTAKSRLEKKTSTHTRAGRALGTPGYAAPEQRRAEPEVDPRADIFSLGVTLYEVLTGQMPVGVFESPSRKVGSPAALDRIILRALQERPELRYQTAAQMQKALAPVAVKLGAPSFRRQILQRPLTAAVIIIQLLVVGWLLWDKLTQGDEKPEGSELEYAAGQGANTLPVTGRLMLFPESLSWNRAKDHFDSHPTLRMAGIRTAAEQAEVVAVLKARGVRAPVWTGGHRAAGEEDFKWQDGSNVGYAAWMPSAVPPPVIVTEIQAKNQRTLRNANGESPDWIEIHNPGTEPVNLGGWHLFYRDDSKAAELRIRPSIVKDVIIAPGAYRLIYFGERRPEEGAIAFSLNLEAQGAIIHWTDPRGQVVQAFNTPWPAFEADMSIGQSPLGDAWGVCEKPTPGQPNSKLVSSLEPPAAGEDGPRSILLLPEFDFRWTMEIPNLKTWVLVERR